MSTIRVDTIQTVTGTEVSTVKAWVTFDGDPVTIRGANNVSSITDNGIGDYTINFTVAMSDNNYAVSTLSRSGNTSGNRGASAAMFYHDGTEQGGITTTSVRLWYMYGADATTSGSKEDTRHGSVMVVQ